MAKFKVIHGDCREHLGSGQDYKLAFADPPFGIGHGYVGFVDKFTEMEYEAFSEEWIGCVWESLASDGVMCLHGNDDLCELYHVIARRFGFRKNRIAHLIQHFRFGQHQDANWINSHCHCLVFAKDPDVHSWNPDAVLVESDRSSTYADSRIAKSARGGKRVPLTVWGIPSDGAGWGRVQGNSRERRAGHPNQLPEKYLERLIRAYSNEGDTVLDPFGGSGTTAVVALALRRNVVTIDVSEASCESIRKRIKEGAVRL